MHKLIMDKRLIWIVCGIIVICGIGIYWWFKCYSITTMIMVRHGDRNSSADELSPLGLARAQKLVHIAEKSGVQAIYHTERYRTQQTAEPTATALQITPTVIPEVDIQGLVTDIFQHHRGGKVLVVGHSHTIPDIISAAGSNATVNIGSNEYDNLFILSACSCKWRTRLVNLQYGEISP
jgi:broad specificity phosphatase PhoE